MNLKKKILKCNLNSITFTFSEDLNYGLESLCEVYRQNIAWKQKVCWHHPAMFFLNTSSKLSHQQFEFSLKVKVIESSIPFKIFSTLIGLVMMTLKRIPPKRPEQRLLLQLPAQVNKNKLVNLFHWGWTHQFKTPPSKTRVIFMIIIKYIFRVCVFWEGHIIWWNLPFTFDQ